MRGAAFVAGMAEIFCVEVVQALEDDGGGTQRRNRDKRKSENDSRSSAIPPQRAKTARRGPRFGEG
jgi:hypothetical protein